ncbi:uncharacterized protein LOC111595577 isoform X4 [Drosophila hydei]|uniref:Uncharacterized protein LOC111595577 isoform X4 n=1 Tax=Drosophila hydei TaxID=7224 RepID=A0A6J1LNL3_DROHY|nr:uncharacterized protein LOC111595577 isoform X4 [Drosophila hydei]
MAISQQLLLFELSVGHKTTNSATTATTTTATTSNRNNNTRVHCANHCWMANDLLSSVCDSQCIGAPPFGC